MTNQLWLQLYKNHKLSKHETRECDSAADAREVMVDMCRALDIPNPMWLESHVREFDAFSRTTFLPAHFVEEVPFERMVIEWIAQGRKGKSDDPRNAF